MRIELEEQEWRQVLAVLSQAPWNVANPLIMAIGEQLRAAQASGEPSRPRGNGAAEAPPAG